MLGRQRPFYRNRRVLDLGQRERQDLEPDAVELLVSERFKDRCSCRRNPLYRQLAEGELIRNAVRDKIWFTLYERLTEPPLTMWVNIRCVETPEPLRLFRRDRLARVLCLVASRGSTRRGLTPTRSLRREPSMKTSGPARLR